MVVKHDMEVRGQKGMYTFRVNGQLFHYAGSGLPLEDEDPCFSQIYTVGDGGTSEAAMRQHHYNNSLDGELLIDLQSAINSRSPYARLFKNANEILGSDEKAKIVIKSVKPGNRKDLKRYNLPTVEEIGMVVPGDGSIDGSERRIVLERQNAKLERITDMHTGYLPMRYVICFPEGAQQWSEEYKLLLPLDKRRRQDEDDQRTFYDHHSTKCWLIVILWQFQTNVLLHCNGLRGFFSNGAIHFLPFYTVEAYFKNW